MTDFKWLEDIVSARTPGQWYANNFSNWFAALNLEMSDADAQFIATMGTVADLLMDVVRAAEDIICDPLYTGTRPKDYCEARLFDALVALKKAGHGAKND